MKKSTAFVLITQLLFIALFAAGVSAQESAPSKWTFMVFINADNNLDRFGILDIQEMEKAAMSSGVNIVAQIDRGYGKPARRYDVTGRAADAQADDWGLLAKNVAELGEVDMGDYKEMVSFVKWAHENYPAENYALVIWNHGAGWKKKENAPVVKGVSYDEQSKNHISTKDLGIAMGAVHNIIGRPLDILAFDACLMQMIEVSYEVRENVKYMVGSEETEPGDGWPYELVCAPLVQTPSMDAQAFAKLIPQAYAQSYGSKGKGCTQSAVDCSRLEELASAVDALALSVMDACAASTSEIEAVKNALGATQKYSYADNIDLGHFAEMLSQTSKNEAVKAALESLKTAYGLCILENRFTGMGARFSTGMAIYFPRYGFNSKYDTIKFSGKNWDDMVRAVTGAQSTAEPPNNGGTSTSNPGTIYPGGYDYPDVYPFPGGGFHPHWPHVPPMPMM